MNRKDECDTSDSAGVFLSGSRHNLRSEGSKRIQIQRQRNQQVKPPLPASNIVSNERVGDEIDTIDTGIGIGHVPKPITPTTASKKQSSLQTTVHEDSDSGMEESNISQIINAGPVTQPPTNTYRYCSTSGKLCSNLFINECPLLQYSFLISFRAKQNTITWWYACITAARDERRRQDFSWPNWRGLWNDTVTSTNDNAFNLTRDNSPKLKAQNPIDG